MAETADSLLAQARLALAQQEIATARLDARLLLQQATGLSHEELVMNPDRLVSGAQAACFHELLARRLRHEPVSRILGQREFYGRDFKVSPAVLDPRPDTETLIDAALPFLKQKPHQRFIDLGTGSGAIAITLAAEVDDAQGLVVDLSPEALALAQENAVVLGVAARLSFQLSDWFSTVAGCFDLIISNPPYIPMSDIAGLAPEVRCFDPLLALAGGEDGLSPYRLIAAEAPAYLTASGRVMVEIGAGQAEAICQIFAEHGFALQHAYPDLGGHMRALVFDQSEAR